jgi:hypothetical protein
MLAQRFTCFDQGHDHSQYYITLCGDIPDNSKPAKVCYKKEPGHVFIILTMQDTVCHTKDISTAFGFYPQRPASSVIFKNVRCEILDNSSRNYDVLIQKDLTAFEFELILEKAISLTQKKLQSQSLQLLQLCARSFQFRIRYRKNSGKQDPFSLHCR